MKVNYAHVTEINTYPLDNYSEEKIKQVKEELKTINTLSLTFDVIPNMLCEGYLLAPSSFDLYLYLDLLQKKYYEDQNLSGSYVSINIDTETRESDIFYEVNDKNINDSLFLYKAYVIFLLHQESIIYDGKKLTQTELSKAAAKFGLKIPQTHVAVYLYVNDLSEYYDTEYDYILETMGRNQFEELKKFEEKIIKRGELLSKDSTIVQTRFRKMLQHNMPILSQDRKMAFSNIENSLCEEWYVPSSFFNN